MVAALVVLGISLWLFAAAETIDHRVQYALALGGLGFLLLGGASALAIETGFAGLADVSAFMVTASFVLGGLLVLGAIAMLVMRGKAGAEGEQSDDDETPGERRFKQVATLLIATLALLGAVAAYLQADAGNRGDTAIRRAQLLAAESLGVQSSGEAQVNFQYGGAAQTWEELKVRANAAIDSGDSKAAARYEAIQQGVAGMSTLLKAPYFDPATGNDPDIAAFQADQYVAKAATLSEASALGGNTENAWEAKSNAYVIHLTLLATALALMGLALTLGGRVRPLFLGVKLLYYSSHTWLDGSDVCTAGARGSAGRCRSVRARGGGRLQGRPAGRRGSLR